MIEFTIPGEARGRCLPRATKQGRVYTPKETVNAEAFIRMIAAAAMAGRPPKQSAPPGSPKKISAQRFARFLSRRGWHELPSQKPAHPPRP
jgi:hypothetical protein